MPLSLGTDNWQVSLNADIRTPHLPGVTVEPVDDVDALGA